jgi:hypothetical protein
VNMMVMGSVWGKLCGNGKDVGIAVQDGNEV